MKRFSDYLNNRISEHCTTSDVNPGNQLIRTGVTNHLTPVGNIVAEIRNLYSPFVSIVASVAEDGFSVKLNSSLFTSERAVYDVIYDSSRNYGISIASLINQHGLNKIKLVNIGQFYICYFMPDDIKGVENEPKEAIPSDIPCTEMLEYGIQEAELSTIVNESDDDEELEDETLKRLKEIFTMKDRVKAAKQLELLVGAEMELPREYYFAGVKSRDGEESIALRWRYTIKRPHGKTSDVVRSILNIYDDSKEGIWVQDFAKDSMFTLPKEVDTLIHSILDFLGASSTDDPSVYSLEESNKVADDEDKKNNQDDDKDNHSDTTEKNDKEQIDNDDEDSSSRGDDSDEPNDENK